MIYFVQAASGGPIKIGTTGAMSERLRTLRTLRPEADLQLLAVMDGGFVEEGAIHKQFSHLAVGGERFNPAADLLDFIAQNGQEWDGSDSPNQRKPFQLRLHPLLRQQLEELAERNASDLTNEISIAIRERLERAGLWPPPAPVPDQDPEDKPPPKPAPKPRRKPPS